MNDPRFTFGLVLDVAEVLADHGYPSLTEPGADTRRLVELQQALFRFLHGEEGEQR